MKLAITPTLLNSFDWYNKMNAGKWKDKAYKDIANKVKRISSPMGPEAIKGIEFEDAVQKICEAGTIESCKASQNFKTVCRFCEGGKFQQWCEFYFTDGEGNAVRAYGKIDVLFEDKIIDIKTTKEYKGPESYTKGWQPAIYCLAKDIAEFQFIVAEWESPESSKVAEVYPVETVMVDAADTHALLVKKYDDFVKFLKQQRLYDAYLYDFCKNPRN